MPKIPSGFRRSPCAALVVLAFFPVLPAAMAQTGVPMPDHVVIVVEENRGFDQLHLSPEAPYINGLAQQGALFIESFALTHPSQPNYLALFSGSAQGVSDDSCPHSSNQPNLASALLGAGFTFAGYSESLPGVGSGTCESGAYVRRHCPWVNFANVPRQLHLPFTQFPTDFNQLPDVCFVIPNLNNDMHDGTMAMGDAWLRQHLDAYVQWAKTHNSLLILTQDEGRNGTDNQILTFFLGPMVVPGQYSGRIDHFTLLRTLLAMYGLPPIARSTNAASITNCWTPESLNLPVTVSMTSPSDGSVFQAPVNLVLTAEAASRDSAVRKVEFFNNGAKLGEATSSPFQLTLISAAPGTYSLSAKATDDLGRRRVSALVQVRVLPGDTTPPTVKITSPAPNTRSSNAVITLRGSATDNVGVSRVECGIGEAMGQVATGTADWSAQLELSPGTNVVWARSVDFQGNVSVPATVRLAYVVTSRLTVETSGPGTVTPNLDGQWLVVGQHYTVTAQPANGYLFAGWSAGAAGGPARLGFEMASNLVLRATFVPNPFLATKGSYNGLFLETNGVRYESSGLARLNITDRGGFSGTLQSGGRRFPVNGQFNLAGSASASVPRVGESPLSIELLLDPEPSADRIRGRVSDGTWTATLLADRAVFNVSTLPSPFAGQYTMDIPPDAEMTGGPAGDGFGTARVGADGRVQFTGTLADHTRLSATATVSKDGVWPFYVSLYGGNGAILGCLKFDRTTDDALQGSLHWFRPASAGSSSAYPSGFTNESAVVGSRYRTPGAQRPLLGWSHGQLEFSGGGLAAPFTNAVVLGLDHKLTNLSSNRLAVTINVAAGTWRGTATDPNTGRNLAFQGALLQRDDIGVGFFWVGNQSGRVLLKGN